MCVGSEVVEEAGEVVVDETRMGPVWSPEEEVPREGMYRSYCRFSLACSRVDWEKGTHVSTLLGRTLLAHVRRPLSSVPIVAHDVHPPQPSSRRQPTLDALDGTRAPPPPLLATLLRSKYGARVVLIRSTREFGRTGATLLGRPCCCGGGGRE